MLEALFEPVKPNENHGSVDKDRVCNQETDVEDDLVYNKSASGMLEYCQG